MSRFFVVASCALAGCCFAACGEYCDYGESSCDGNALLRCYESDGAADHTFVSADSSCRSLEQCIEVTSDDGDRHAVCSRTGEPDPRCFASGSPLPGSRRLCDGSTLLQCLDGYSSIVRECDSACVEPGTSAFCALEPTPSPACDGLGENDGLGCDGVTTNAAVLSCRSGYEIDRIACASDQQCVEAATPYHRPYCASDEPCEGSNTFCRLESGSSTIEGCVDGRTVSMTCNEGTSCEQFGVLGPDNRPTGASEAQCIRR